MHFAFWLRSSHACRRIAADSTPAFKRGATLVEFFEFPKTAGDGADKSYADPAYPHPQSALSLFDFDELHRIGFDHMRVPLDVGPLLQGDAQEQKDILEQLVAVVSAINRHGLAVLVTLFPPSLHHELPQSHSRRARRSEIPRLFRRGRARRRGARPRR